ncbi:MAG: hypothetical protein C0404_10240 [Verrucomicrobia bacterium]|nr:hypothetical protein [Verrucomicrobiota bacterium]
MARSFSIVDQKVAEAEFFLKKLRGVEFDFFAARCFVSAFVTSARSITYALQAVMKPVPRFQEWYRMRQEEMKADSLSRFFHNLRTVSHHIGDNLASGGSAGPNQSTRFWFIPTKDIPEVPQDDVASACESYFTSLVEVVYKCYLDFGTEINSHQHYTSEHFATLGKTIEDAEEETFGIRGWTHVSGYSEEYRWQAIRDQMIGCEIDDIFREYLGKETPRPPRLQSP